MASLLSTLASMEQPCPHKYAHAPNLLPDLALSVCAVCLMEARIREVKFTQAALARRRGIFESSNAGPEVYAAIIDGQNRMTHKDWTSRWKRVKLDCWRLVVTLEKIRDERLEIVEEWGVDEALYLWELAKDECWQVPGCRYVDNCASDEEKLTQQSQAAETVSEPESKQEEDSENSWETVKRRWKNRSRSLRVLSQDENEQLDTDQVVLNEMEEVNNRLENLDSTPGNRLDELAEDGEGTATAAVAKATTKSRSVLNGDTIPTASPSRKSVSIDAQATILAYNDIPATTMSHSEHTVMEQSRKRFSYNRNSRFYAPSSWASPEGYEKDDTSYHKKSWVTVIELQKEFARSDMNLDKKEEVLTGKTEEVAFGEAKKVDAGEVKPPGAFRAPRPPRQGEKLSRDSFSSSTLLQMRDSFARMLTEDVDKSSLSPSQREGLASDLKDCNNALAQERRLNKESEKKWTDAESER